jgi:hypothetical protein
MRLLAYPRKAGAGGAENLAGAGRVADKRARQRERRTSTPDRP